MRLVEGSENLQELEVLVQDLVSAAAGATDSDEHAGHSGRGRRNAGIGSAFHLLSV